MTFIKNFNKKKKLKLFMNDIHNSHVGLGDLGVTCLPRDLRFAGSNPAEVD